MSMGLNLDSQGPDRYSAMSEINVTPLVDIMLVLLIIFMVAAPLMTQGVEVDLPDADAKALSTGKEPLIVSVASDGTPYIEERSISIEALAAKIAAIKKNNPTLPVYVRGDHQATYGSVMKVMAQLQSAGVSQLGLVTEPPN